MCTTFVLKSRNFPWEVVASSLRTGKTKLSPSSLVGEANTPPVTNLDVLHAVHITLAGRVTPQEWMALGHQSHAQMEISRAYERRCVRMGGGWDEGVRRIDYLRGKTYLVGVELEKSAGGESVVGRLVFAKA